MFVRYLGHLCFVLKVDGLKILIDPFLSGNPNVDINPLSINPDVILLSHDHEDHLGDTVNIAKSSFCDVVCVFDLAQELSRFQIKTIGANIGGTVRYKGLEITFVKADHSSTKGVSVGFVIKSSKHVIYFAGDTGVFYDMKIIKDLYAPDIAILPIGDFFTMGPRQACYAIKLLEPKIVIPMHYNTFDNLTGTPEKFRLLINQENLNVNLIVLDVGEKKEM